MENMAINLNGFSRDQGISKELSETAINLLKKQGYFYLKCDSRSGSKISSLFTASDIFFNSNISDKRNCESKDKAKRGYSEILSDNFASLVGEHGPNDLVEKFRIGPLQDTKIDTYYNCKEGRRYFYPNNWQGAASVLYPAATTFYEYMEKVTLAFLCMLEHGLGLPPNRIIQNMDKHTSILALNHYPDLPLDSISHSPQANLERGQTNKFRIAEHTDVSMFTILTLSPSSPEGLEIQTPAAPYDWHKVNYIPDTMIVIVGECFEYWSQSFMKATKHRVRLPESCALPQDGPCPVGISTPSGGPSLVASTTASSETFPPHINNSRSENTHLSNVEVINHGNRQCNRRQSFAYFISPNYNTALHFESFHPPASHFVDLHSTTTTSNLPSSNLPGDIAATHQLIKDCNQDPDCISPCDPLSARYSSIALPYVNDHPEADSFVVEWPQAGYEYDVTRRVLTYTQWRKLKIRNAMNILQSQGVRQAG